jgi:hypothetical protein
MIIAVYPDQHNAIRSIVVQLVLLERQSAALSGFLKEGPGHTA